MEVSGPPIGFGPPNWRFILLWTGKSYCFNKKVPFSGRFWESGNFAHLLETGYKIDLSNWIGVGFTGGVLYGWAQLGI
jgi:hypothetical protein